MSWRCWSISLPSAMSARSDNNTGTCRLQLDDGSHLTLRQAAQRIVFLRRGTNPNEPKLREQHHGAPSEPGLDPRLVDLIEENGSPSKSETSEQGAKENKDHSRVRIVDYSSSKYSNITKSPAEFSSWYQAGKPEWASVRWVHLDGLSWVSHFYLSICRSLFGH